MYDGTTTTFEKLKRPDSVAVFPVMDDGRIILTKQEQPGKKPFIGAAGGRVDEGEDILDAAKRELLEETGYEAEKFALWKSMQPTSKIEWAVFFFVARGLTKVNDMSPDSGEKIELMPVSFEEFLRVSPQSNFMEQEIYQEILGASFDEKKEQELRELLKA
jgi:ADP-ribose pyrophosphatase